MYPVIALYVYYSELFRHQPFFLQNKRNWAKIWLIFDLAEFIRILEQETELSLTNRATRIVQMQ